MEMSLLTEIEFLLKSDERFIADGKLLKNEIIDNALKHDSTLITLLLSNEKTKKHFFINLENILIFDKDKFIQFLDNKEFLPDSYTSFKNKIGITLDKKYLSETSEVVLSWPYKDCILEGEMTKEDQKRNEIFWNAILAPDEVSRLLDPKVLTNFKKIDINGINKTKEFNHYNNLIIRGNNLLVLHCLKEKYTGKVKLIYIDPPYNKEGSNFYNDNFKHSTWLTFMKNRLEVAKELLSHDGLIWISISDAEAFHLKIICDDIFGRDNFLADVIWNSTKSVTNTAIISNAHTHNLVYSSNIELLKKNRTSFRLAADEKRFSNPDNDPRGKWTADPFQVGGERPNQMYEITNPNTGEVYLPNPGNSWKNEKIVFDRLIKENRIVFGKSGEAGPQRKRFWSEAKERGEVTTTLWTDLPTTTNASIHLKQLFKDRVFDNPKPEGLIKRIIELSTKEGDIVLDFFGGSGTTATTALKMNRKFILCEQMDYVEDVTVQRLKKVIEGEKGGISEEVEWKGGGEFIYCELMKYNEEAIDRIHTAKSTEDLIKIWAEMVDHYFLNYDVDIHKFNENVEGFKNLTLEEQKKVLVEMLNKNQLYVNLSEIEDAQFKVSDEDKELNKKFYRL